MASMAVASAGMPSPSTTSRRLSLIGSNAILKTSVKARLPKANSQVVVQASSSPSIKERAVAGLTAAALAAALVIPDVAEAAQPGISPSLKNFLLSITAGGVVLGILIGAVIGVSNFDPVKRT